MREYMINLEYTTTPQETSQTTLIFLANRPLVSMLFFMMKITCILLLIGFTFTVYAKAVRPQDIVSAIMALVWLFCYKAINRWVIKSALKARRFTDVKYNIKIDDKSIICRFANDSLQYIEWKKLKYVLDTQDGYVIPLTGFSNAGKFLWLPIRAFINPIMQQDFLQLVANAKLKIKKVKN